MCCRERRSSSASSQPQIWLSGDSWLDLGWLISVEACGMQAHLFVSPLDQFFFFFLSQNSSESLALLLPSLLPFLRPILALVFCHRMTCACVCVFGCFRSVLSCVYVPVFACSCVCVCVGTHPSVHPTSNQWCQPFDACSTVTKPYCTHPYTHTLTYTPLYCTNLNTMEKNLHCFSLTSDTFILKSI